MTGQTPQADRLVDRPSGTCQPPLVDRQLVAPGIDRLAQALDGQVGQLLADRLEPLADVVELPGHRLSMADAGGASVTT